MMAGHDPDHDDALAARLPCLTDRPSYLRLCLVRRDERFHLQQGFLRAAGRLRNSGTMSEEDSARLRETLRWFNRNLPAPRRLRRVHAVFWFKAEIVRERPELLRKIAELGRLLILSRHRLMWIKTDRPGKVVYEDAYQVAAVPFTETFRDARRVTLPVRPSEKGTASL